MDCWFKIKISVYDYQVEEIVFVRRVELCRRLFPHKALWWGICRLVFNGLLINDFRCFSIDPIESRHHPANQKMTPNGIIIILRSPCLGFFLNNFFSSPIDLYHVSNNKIC